MLVALVSVDSASLEASRGDMLDMSLRESLRVTMEEVAGAMRMLDVGVTSWSVSGIVAAGSSGWICWVS